MSYPLADRHHGEGMLDLLLSPLPAVAAMTPGIERLGDVFAALSADKIACGHGLAPHVT